MKEREFPHRCALAIGVVFVLPQLLEFRLVSPSSLRCRHRAQRASCGVDKASSLSTAETRRILKSVDLLGLGGDGMGQLTNM